MCSHLPALRRGCVRLAGLVILGQTLTNGAPIATHVLTAHMRGANSPVSAGLLAWETPAAVAAPLAKGAGNGAVVKWTCPMHPHYIADEFGACPLCGMDLVKLETGSGTGAAATAEERAIITVAPEVIQSIGVRLAPVERVEFGRSVRSFGTITENQRLQSEITARVEGWIEELAVTAVGDPVDRDMPLFKLYSPQLIISQSDYFRSRGDKDLAARGIGQLRAFGVQDAALAAMQSVSEPVQRVPFFADRRGTVAELAVKQGSYVTRGMLIARIQDYSSVWLQVSVAERDLGSITLDTPATVTFPSLPGRAVTARVDFIYPTIDVKTRTGQVRLVIDNEGGVIRPGSYADVVFDIARDRRLAVPQEAVLKSAAGRYVVVSVGQGRFEPRAVETGVGSGRWIEITRGLAEEETVVVSGQFLLDSESALREAFRKIERFQTPLSLLSPDASQMAMIDHLVDAALYVHEALVDGYDVDARQLDAALSIRELLWPRYKDTKLAFVLDDSAAALKEAQASRSEGEVRAALAKLVAALKPWVMTGAPEHYRTKGVTLYQDTDGARLWLQLAGRTANPYGPDEGRLIGPATPAGAASAHSAAAVPAQGTSRGK